MPAVSIQNLIKSYAGRTVLESAGLDLHLGRKVGLIGANGCGKTTLFKLIVGREEPDSGIVSVARGLSIGYLPQEPDLQEGSTLIDAVGSAFADHRRLESRIETLSHDIADAHGRGEHDESMVEYDRLRARFEAAGGYDYEVRLREVLGGLGFQPEEYQTPVSVLSGGQKCRAALARLLLQECDLLLLDEPTNHLDIDAVAWLEKYLSAHEGGAVIISHDRYLLDRVVTGIIEIEDHRIATYPTSYTNYAEAKRIRRLQALREYDNQAAWLAHQRDYIDRARYAKDSAKQARGRQKYIDRMEADGKILKAPKGKNARMNLKLQTSAAGGDMVVRCEKACKGFGDVVLIRDLDFEMTRGEKVGIIGPNGVGKTTLLRMLMRQIAADSGTVRLFENLSVGYYDQEHRDLDGSLTVIDSVRAARPGTTEAETRSYLARFLFRGDEVFKRVGQLSGGEQSRVLLARLVWTAPQVLVLDEPTNHLDIPAREVLEEALRDYAGSVLMVSHDRYFLDRVADSLLVLPRRGEHELVAGNWSVYAAILAKREEASRVEDQRRREEAKEKNARREAAKKKPSRSKYAVESIAKLEAGIIEHETRLKEMEAAFADPATQKDAARAKQLHDDYYNLKTELASLIEQWELAVDSQT